MQQQTEMIETELAPAFYVGDVLVEPRSNTITRSDAPAERIEPRAVQVLLQLVAEAPQFVDKRRLLATVWEGRCVTDDTVGQAIMSLRRAFGDDYRNPKVIETRKNVGYRLLVPVTRVAKKTMRPWRRATAVALGILICSGLWLAIANWDSPSETRVALLSLTPAIGDDRSNLELLTADLITALARSKNVELVRPPAAAASGVGASELPQLAKSLQVDYFLEGFVEHGQVHFEARLHLIDGRDGSYAAVFDWVGSANTEAAAATALAGQLSAYFAAPAQAVDPFLNLPSSVTQSLAEAGYLLAAETPVKARAALDLYRSVAARYPRLTEAQVGAAASLLRLYLLDPRTQHLEEALQLAGDAVAVAPSASGYAVLAKVVQFLHWDLPGAERLFQKSLALEPNHRQAVRGYAWLLVALERYAEARPMLARLEVVAPEIYAGTEGARLLLAAGDYVAAVAKLLRLAQVDSPSTSTLKWLAVAQLSSGDMTASAKTWLRFVQRQKPALTEPLEQQWSDGGYQAIFATLAITPDLLSPAFQASLLTALGREDEAELLVRQLLGSRSPAVLFLNTIPNLRSITARVPELRAPTGPLISRAGTARDIRNVGLLVQRSR